MENNIPLIKMLAQFQIRTAEEWPDNIILKIGEPGVQIKKDGGKIIDAILKVGDGEHNFN
jgi:hypothetical protein